MRDDQIRVKPFELLEMNRFSMIKKENEHSVAAFAGRILDALEEKYMKMALEDIDAEVVIQQFLEPDAMEEILKEAKKNDVGRAAAFLKEASKTVTELRELEVRGIADVADGVNIMARAARLNQSQQRARQTEITPMDVLGALPINKTLKDRGIQDVLGTLNRMKDAGVLKTLRSESPAEVAKTENAHEAIYKELILLKGVVTELSVRTENEVKILYGTVKSPSCLMDVTPRVRTWQAGTITYYNMMETILAPYEKRKPGCIMTVEDRPIETFVLQYKETDWEFARRMASHQNRYLVADDLTGGVRFYYGMPKPRTEETPEITTNSYGIEKRLTEYLAKRDNKVPDILERDAMYYQITEREVYYIGDKVKFNGEELYISRIESSLRGSEIYHTYTLKTKNGFKLPYAYNAKAIGVSLSGVILEPSKDVVKVKLDDDENSEGCETRWFPYSTVYSSPDGTGWYCMPEPGDAIRLYMPSDDEREAYVISAVHLVRSNGGCARTNPDHKSIMNKYGKEILFTPNSITFTNNKGIGMSIIDGVGIKLFSDKNIEIASSDAIEIVSEGSEIKIIAPKSITLIQSGTSVTMEKNIILKGAQTNIQ